MVVQFLDAAIGPVIGDGPSIDSIVKELVAENFVPVVLLLIFLLLAATAIVNAFVIGKYKPKDLDDQEQPTEEELI